MLSTQQSGNPNTQRSHGACTFLSHKKYPGPTPPAFPPTGEAGFLPSLHLHSCTVRYKDPQALSLSIAIASHHSRLNCAERDRAFLVRSKKKMAVSNVDFGVLAIAALVLAVALPVVQAQASAPAPAPTSDGTAIDQGIACLLMLVALVLTYLIHAVDFSCSF